MQAAILLTLAYFVVIGPATLIGRLFGADLLSRRRPAKSGWLEREPRSRARVYRGRGVRILGVRFDYHDAAAALVVDGVPVAAASAERFTRVKHDRRLPESAARWCLSRAGLEAGDLDALVFSEKPLPKTLAHPQQQRK